jgi:hypothetical protein
MFLNGVVDGGLWSSKFLFETFFSPQIVRDEPRSGGRMVRHQQRTTLRAGEETWCSL